MREISTLDIEGFNIGNATDTINATGCTAIIAKDGAVGGVSVRGGGPATRETELLNPTKMVEKIHCVMLSGGSAYGLDAGSGAMEYLEERGIGFNVGVGVVPIVVGASLFDLVVGNSKVRPSKEMGYKACINSEDIRKFNTGNFGAGTGATVGKYLGLEYLMKSGLGAYAVEIGNVKIGAIVAVNALGDIYDIDTGEIIKGLLNEEKNGFRSTYKEMLKNLEVDKNVFAGNTTIGCIITNAKLSKPQANRLAEIGHNGYAQAIKPVHTSADGDTIFAMASGLVDVNSDSLNALGSEVMARAIMNGARTSKSAYGIFGDIGKD